MQEFGQMIIQEVTAAHHSWAVTRSNLIREIMEPAELLQYEPITGPAGITISGIDAYSRVVELADLEELQDLRDAAFLVVKGRQRLELLSKRLGGNNCDAGQHGLVVTNARGERYGEILSRVGEADQLVGAETTRLPIRPSGAGRT